MDLSTLPTEVLKEKFFKAVFLGKLQKLKAIVRVLMDERGFKAEDVMEIRDPAGKNVLFVVALWGYVDMCKFLVEELKFDIHEQDENGDTPFLFSGDHVIAAYLMDQGSDPNSANDSGLTLLHLAARKGLKDLVRLLISRGAKVDPEATVIGTPLQLAAAEGVSSGVGVLLENHANPNSAGPDTLPPLLSAIKAKSIGCVRQLLEFDCKPIEIAAMLGNHDAVEALFPVTEPVPDIPDWSVRGILVYIRSAEANIRGKLNIDRRISLLKAKGAEAVKRILYQDAACFYTDALSLKPTDATLWSNRSLCRARLGQGDLALEDALECIELRDNWPKAHYRAGAAYALLHDYRKAEEEYGIALELDPNSKELQDAYREAVLDLQAIQQHEIETLGSFKDFELDEQDEAYAEYMSSFL